MRKRPPDENADASHASHASAKPAERPTVRPLRHFAEDGKEPASERDESHERARPRFPQLMSAFTNYLASTQPTLEAAGADGATCRSLLGQMSKLFSQGDFDGALAVADGVAAEHPGHDVVAYCARTCRTELEGNYRARLGGFEHAPRRIPGDEDLLAVALDHREAFLVSQIDGATPYEALVDVSPLPRFVTLSILDRLLSLGVIE
jgi:hypothetical protein